MPTYILTKAVKNGQTFNKCLPIKRYSGQRIFWSDAVYPTKDYLYFKEQNVKRKNWMTKPIIAKDQRINAADWMAAIENTKNEGIAMLTGNRYGSDFICVDLDLYKLTPEEQAKTEWVRTFGDDPVKRFDTYTDRTGSGGIHLWFKYDKRLPRGTTNEEHKIDILSNGGICVMSGSSYEKDGVTYKYTNIHDVEAKQIPDDLVEWLLTNIYTKNERNAMTMKKKKTAGDDDALDVPFHFHQYELDEQATRDLIISRLPAEYLRHNPKNWITVTCLLKILGHKKLWDELAKPKCDKCKEVWDTVSPADSIPTVEAMLKVAQGKEGLKKYLRFIKFKKSPDDTFSTPDPSQVINAEKLGYELNIDDVTKGVSYVIKSDTGTGKTWLFQDLMERLNAGENQQQFISIVSRRSLAREQIRVFEKCDNYEVEHYEEICFDNPFTNETNVVTTLESLIKFSWKRNWSDYVVFIDEFNSVLEHLVQSTTMAEKRTDVLLTLVNVLQSAKAIVAVDADISPLCFIFLKEIGLIHKIQYVVNKFNHNKDVVAQEVFSRSAMVKMMKKEPKFMLATDSRKIAEFYSTEFPDAKLLVSNPLEEEFRGALNDYDRVIFSPKVVYGLDSTLGRPVFCDYTTLTISPTNMVQQVARERKLSKIYYMFASKNYKKPLWNTYTEAKEQLLLAKTYGNEWMETQPCPMADNIYNQMKIFYEYKRDCFDTNKRLHFRNILKQRGVKLDDESFRSASSLYPEDVDIDEVVAGVRLKGFTMDNEMLKEYNEKYLGLTDEQIMTCSELFTDPQLMTNYYSLRRVYDIVSEDYEGKNEKQANEMMKRVAKEGGKCFDDEVAQREYLEHLNEFINPSNVASFLNANRLMTQLREQKDFTLSKLTGVGAMLVLAEQIKTATQTEFINGKIVCAKPMREGHEKNEKLLKDYQTIMSSKKYKAEDFTKKEKCEGMVANIYKKALGRELIENKKVRDGKKTMYEYYVNKEMCGLFEVTKRIGEYQLENMRQGESKRCSTITHGYAAFQDVDAELRKSMMDAMKVEWDDELGEAED